MVFFMRTKQIVNLISSWTPIMFFTKNKMKDGIFMWNAIFEALYLCSMMVYAAKTQRRGITFWVEFGFRIFSRGFLNCPLQRQLPHILQKSTFPKFFKTWKGFCDVSVQTESMRGGEHSLNRGLLQQSCSTAAQDFTKYVDANLSD